MPSPSSRDSKINTALTTEQFAEYSNLTNSQLMIWMGQQLELESPLYNMVLCFRFQGSIDPEHFHKAFSCLVSSSDALRTVIEVINGVPQQRVLKQLNYQVKTIDLSDAADPQQALADWTAIHNGQQFDLSQCSFESTLLNTGDGHSVWYLNQHHLAMDVWSTSLIYKNVAALYSASLKGELPVSINLPSWIDFIQFEKNQQYQESYRKAVAYWQQRSQQQIEPICFYSRKPLVKHAATQRVACLLGENRTHQLKQLALCKGIRELNINLTLFNLFLTALSSWLYRISGSRKMVIGTPAHNRSSLAFRETIGLFIEMFPLIIEHQDEQTFRQLLSRVAAESQSWLRHAKPGAGSMAGVRQFNVVLNYIHATFAPFANIPVEAEWMHTGFADSRHDLRLQVHDFGDKDSFLLYFDFNLDTFDNDLQHNAIAHFLSLLDAFIENPDRRIDQVALATSQEKQRYLIDYNDTELPARPTCTVLDLFKRQCLKTPQAPAILQDTKQFSYADLDSQSELLATQIQQRGYASGSLVGVFLSRSIEMIIAIFAVLKAGAGYIPLESRLPHSRLKYILQDTGVKFVLTESALLNRLQSYVSDTLCLDQPNTNRVAQVNTRPNADDVAYVIYTSGSTGQPKGVVIEHRGLHEYVCWARDSYSNGLPFNFALHSNFGFDLTVTSLFVPLTSGGAIVVYPEQDISGDLSIIKVFEDNRSDIVKLTPAHLRLVLSMDVSKSRVSRLILGGEDLKSELCHRALNAFTKGLALYNEYGPTEAVVGCMVHRFDPQTDTDSSVPIGKPAANTRIYILDAGLNPVPQGVMGEMYINRRGLAKAYLGRQDLTAEHFIADPFVAGQMMYKTGDLARFRVDGVMEYLGRVDQQIKIRGVRIELAEIEHALSEHPDIQQSVLRIIQPEKIPHTQSLQYCIRCGLASNYPNVSFDSAGICNTCLEYDSYRSLAQTYFKNRTELADIFAQIKNERKGKYDCLVLLSGGKDSTYALAQVVAMGMKVLAFTLDNGFISDAAKRNIQRVVDDLGVDHVFGQTPVMNKIFVDSLERHSNVCQGCFKVIYTLSMQLAVERNIACIVTGLSRGQFFETRLTAELFSNNHCDVEAIDQMVMDARKAYHRVDDAVSQLMDVSLFQDDKVFDDIRFVDFYRYCDVGLTEMLAYLKDKLPWIRPSDTGRSTNCLINDTGIHVHKRKQHFHNYALPYSWDVRLGVKQRDEALEELDDNIDIGGVYRILNEINYNETGFFANPDDKRLAAYYTATGPLPVSELKRWLEQRLPTAMIPSFLVQLEHIPLTENGKPDISALPAPNEQRPQLEQDYRAPGTELEKTLARIWSEALGIQQIGINDNYFDLGGDSIVAIQIVASANNTGIRLAPNELFLHQTIAELAVVAEPIRIIPQGKAMMPGFVPLTPIQHWFFAQRPKHPDHFNQSVRLHVDSRVNIAQLQSALDKLLTWHDALGLQFHHHKGSWIQQYPAQTARIRLQRVKLEPDTRGEHKMQQVEIQAHQSLNLAQGKLVAAVLFEAQPEQDNIAKRQLLLIVHHLVIDVVSWLTVLQDLDSACKQLADSQVISLPPRTSNWCSWTQALQKNTATPLSQQEQSFWLSQSTKQAIPLPHEGMLESTRRCVSVVLPVKNTQCLLDQALSYRQMQMHEILLAGLALTLAQYTRQSMINISIESHGREAIDSTLDTTRTVGWFTALYPLVMQVDNPDRLDESIGAVKQKLDELPRRGIGYGMLNYMNEAPTQPWGGVLFNYMGRTTRLLKADSWFHIAGPLKVSRAADSRMCFSMEINSYLGEDGLHIDWSYSDVMYSKEEIAQLSEALLNNLNVIAEYRAVTPKLSADNDFALANLDNNQLNKLAALLNKD